MKKVLKKPARSGPAAPPEIRDDETVETAGPFYFIQKKKSHKLTSDTVLLCGFIPDDIRPESRIIDLGTGTGAISLLLAGRFRDACITGVEIDRGSFDSAIRNIEANGLAPRCTAVNSDYRDLPSRYQAGSFDIVVSNPPYTKKGAGRVSPYPNRQIARSEVHGVLDDLVRVSRYLINDTGRIFYVFPAARLFEMIKEAKKAGLFVRRLRFIHFDARKPARLFLIELGKPGLPGQGEGRLIIEEPLFA